MVTALCPVPLAPGASVAIPVVSVPMGESAVPRLELVLVLLGGMELVASFPARWVISPPAWGRGVHSTPQLTGLLSPPFILQERAVR